MVKGIYIRQLFVRALSRRATSGTLIAGHLRLPCALGRGGCKPLKREGDGATPLGRFRLRFAYFRPDRLSRPQSRLRVVATRPDDGWCDAAGDRNYNRPVRRPYPASTETLWRAGQLYDIVVVLGYNDRPRIQGRGSAIFLHVARGAFEPTEGCVALRRADLRKLLPLLGPRTVLRIGA
jgi:L,D-peptidoglycan transpeptidase YkuD (ErfK/YbiS/YcfS/YnhG family)